jgi:hypothetical protein
MIYETWFTLGKNVKLEKYIDMHLYDLGMET